MSNSQDDLLELTVENWLLRNAGPLRQGAIGDVVRRMLAAGVLARSKTRELISRAGGSPEDVLAMVRQEAPHLFGDPEPDAAPIAPPTAPPKPRPSADARLSQSNGHEPFRLETARAR